MTKLEELEAKVAPKDWDEFRREVHYLIVGVMKYECKSLIFSKRFLLEKQMTALLREALEME